MASSLPNGPQRPGMGSRLHGNDGGRLSRTVEVKAAATVMPSDFRGLRRLKEASGDRFAAGVVLYDGEIASSFGEGMFAMPIRSLCEGRTVGPGSFVLDMDRLA